MTTVLFAGSDIRVAPELLDASWDAARRGGYLLRPDVGRPLSVDPDVWPRPEHAGGVLGPPLPWVPVSEVRRRWMAAKLGTEGGWVAIVLGVVALDSRALERLATARGVDTALESGPTWRFLGYDVADSGNISGLSNCGFSDGEMDRLRAAWASRINEHGLIAELSDATSFGSLTDERVPEHAPFEVYGVWLVP